MQQLRSNYRIKIHYLFWSNQSYSLKFVLSFQNLEYCVLSIEGFNVRNVILYPRKFPYCNNIWSTVVVVCQSRQHTTYICFSRNTWIKVIFIKHIYLKIKRKAMYYFLGFLFYYLTIIPFYFSECDVKIIRCTAFQTNIYKWKIFDRGLKH